MTIEVVWAQLEQELSWRQAEIRFLSNSRSTLRKEDERDRFRRAQLVMLYAHAEGFCRIALLLYVKAINERRIRRSMARDELIASSLDDVFHALIYGDIKRKVFRSALPDDEGLYIQACRRDFVHELGDLLDATLELPDSTVNTESNLKARILRKNFFRLGFPPDLIASYEASLDELANRRHKIAHGEDDQNVRASDYDRLQRAVFAAMDHLALSIIDALEKGAFLRAVPETCRIDSYTVGEMR